MTTLLQRRVLREEAVLSSLKKLDYLSRSQIQRLHELGGDRNTRRILDDMSEYLSKFRGENGENIYYLSKAGRERIGSNTVRNKSNQVGHYLMRNDVYIHYRPTEWRREVKVTAEGAITVIPDAFFRYKQMFYFLEVDHLQRMYKNRDKIDRYKKLKNTGVFQEKYHYFPKLMWVTLTASRKEQLLEYCEGLNVIVHVWDEIK